MNYAKILKEVLKYAPMLVVIILNKCKSKKEKPSENNFDV